MHIPEHFLVTDDTDIFRFIDQNGFGQLTSSVDGHLYTSHLPFLLNEESTRLGCHVARQNPQWKEIAGQEVLVSLAGPHAYVSPTWYQRDGVPTWNYQVVHIYGTASVFEKTDRLREQVETLSDKYEVGSELPWRPDFPPGMLKAIMGIEIEISRIEAKYKLSQNKTEADRRNVMKQLWVRGQEDIVEAMQAKTF